MTSKFTWTLSHLFATLLLIIGSGLLLWTLSTNFGTHLSVDATVTAGMLGLAGLVFLHPIPFNILAPAIGIISLTLGYATFYSTAHSWLSASIAVIVMVAILSYGFNLRRALRQRHNQWPA
ncbi:hypothetical protein [Lactiplantibacillus daowaiensis]|uniref:Integral membrane protein n=1 Tax=Lactiplantibacillus daowaiensis TaxID=2559918 RepID=A0ABW1S3Q8_9LACO|nr:hypothetical protein [Lactiplantibacillus daowaiensis]